MNKRQILKLALSGDPDSIQRIKAELKKDIFMAVIRKGVNDTKDVSLKYVNGTGEGLKGLSVEELEALESRLVADGIWITINRVSPEYV